MGSRGCQKWRLIRHEKYSQVVTHSEPTGKPLEKAPVGSRIQIQAVAKNSSVKTQCGLVLPGFFGLALLYNFVERFINFSISPAKLKTGVEGRMGIA